MKMRVTTTSADETRALGEAIGKRLRGGELLQLVGDMGAGKTTFVSGLARGMGSDDPVSSPTFTICNSYYGDTTLHHCDFYRLENDQLIEEELSELLTDESAVVLEWAERLRRLPHHVYVSVEVAVTGEDSRDFTLTIPEEYRYIYE